MRLYCSPTGMVVHLTFSVCTKVLVILDTACLEIGHVYMLPEIVVCVYSVFQLLMHERYAGPT